MKPVPPLIVLSIRAARFVTFAEHDALHPHSEPALIAQPAAGPGRRLRFRNQPGLGRATRQHEHDSLIVGKGRFDGALIGPGAVPRLTMGELPTPSAERHCADRGTIRQRGAREGARDVAETCQIRVFRSFRSIR